MEEFPDLPEEFTGPLLPVMDLLKKVNIHLNVEKKLHWKEYCRLSFSLMCSAIFQIALTMYWGNVFKGDLKMDKLAYVVSVYVVCVQTMLKALVVVLHKKEIWAIILQMGRMWRTEDLTEVQINKKNAILKRLKFCYAVFYSINMISTWQYVLAPLLETVSRKFILQQECELLLPFSCSFPFDPFGNWLRYIGVYIFEIYCSLRIAYYSLGSDFIMITLCSHLATEFTLLQEDFQNMKPNNLAELKTVVENHQKLISLAQQLDDVFDKVTFINLSSATISLCFFGFSAKVSRGVLPLLKSFVSGFALTLPLINLCYYGQCLIEASAAIADSVYSNLWYQGDIRYQKLILIIIRRSQKPCCLTSLKLKSITLNTFTTVLSTTWSYFSLVSSLYEGEN